MGQPTGGYATKSSSSGFRGRGWRPRRRTYRRKAPARRYPTRRKTYRRTFRRTYGRRRGTMQYKVKYVGPGRPIGNDSAIGRAIALGARQNGIGYRPSSFQQKVLTINNDLHQYRWLAEESLFPGAYNYMQFHPSMAYDRICGSGWGSHTAYGQPTSTLFAYMPTERYILKQWSFNMRIIAADQADLPLRLCWAIPRFKTNLMTGAKDQFWNHNLFEHQNSAYWKILSTRHIRLKSRSMPTTAVAMGTGENVVVSQPIIDAIGEYRYSDVIPINTMFQTSSKVPPTNANSWDNPCDMGVAPILFIDTGGDINGESSTVTISVYHEFQFYHVNDS